MTKIAIPQFTDDIAPLFDAASHLAIYQAQRDQPVLSEILVIQSPHALDRVRKLREAGISILICNGIGNQSKNMLQTSGITVINRVTGSVGDALKAFYNGKLCGSNGDPILQRSASFSPLSDLVTQTRALFEKHGYKVYTAENRAPFPVDLEAEISCPICGKIIRVAICCGMHFHRMDEEIRAFHNSASELFNALVYSHPAGDEVEKTCVEYGIQLIDPLQTHGRRTGGNIEPSVPLLKKLIDGHEKCLKA